MARRGSTSVRPELCRRVGVGHSTRLRTGLRIWAWLTPSFDFAALRCAPFRFAQDERRGGGCAAGLPMGDGPSTRLRTGLPGGPILTFPQRGEGTIGLFLGLFVPPGMARRGSISVRPELCRRVGVGPSTRLRTGLRVGAWPTRVSFDFAALRCAPFRFAQDERRGGVARRACPWGLALRRGSGQALPGAPILTFPQQGEGIIGWSSPGAGLAYLGWVARFLLFPWV